MTTPAPLRRILATTAAALWLTLGACTAVPGAGVASAAGDVPPPGAVPGPALWKVADGDTTIYLFGTVHALPKEQKWYDDRIAKALGSAGELVTEIEVGQTSSAATTLAARGVLPAGGSLRSLMSEADRQQYEAALVSLGLPVEALDKYRPWFAAMTLSLLPLLKSGYQTQSGVEQALNAETGERKRGALETVEEQIAVFDTMPQDEQLAFLDQTVEALPKASVSLDAMVAEWQQGHADKLAALINSDLTDPKLRTRLLTNRNANWATWIQRRMTEPGTVFVAVGAGHLAGDGSVQDQLRKLGIPVQRVWQ